MLRLTLFVPAIAAIGCLGNIEPPPLPQPALQDVLVSLGSPLRKMNDAPIPSVAVPGAFIDLWISEVGASQYAQVRTSQSGSGVVLPAGTTILRVVQDRLGQVTRFTALIKREDGFFPPADLFFAVYEADGQKAVGADGSPQEGKMEACMACHRTRPGDAYLFGWPDGGTLSGLAASGPR